MSSQAAIVTPAELRRFAAFLEESIKRIRAESKRMRESVETARAVWKDDKYEAFQKQISGCLENLEKFNGTGLKYAEFLDEKARLADRYLRDR